MSRNILIFGNGIGRALSNEFFDLAPAMRQAWDDSDLLSEQQKELIRACLPEDVIEKDDAAPSREEELEVLQRIVSACDEIASVEKRIGDGSGWLSEEGLQFPRAIRTYLHKVASYFLDREGLPVDKRQLSPQFSAALRAYIMEKGANIVTLNYDDLLNDCFYGTSVFKEHRLRDGFLDGRFQISRHDAWLAQDQEREGWFLHLHGSPLFLTKKGEPQKLTRPELRGYGGFDSTHLVLTNVKYKSSIIEASEILREYWLRFQKCCADAKNVLVIGYGGGDDHLNEAIARVPDNARVRVVQSQYDGRDVDQLSAKWRELLCRSELEIILVSDMKEFCDFEG